MFSDSIWISVISSGYTVMSTSAQAVDRQRTPAIQRHKNHLMLRFNTVSLLICMILYD